MERTSIILAAAIRRQRILNVLLERGQLQLAEIASLTGETKLRCSTDLNTGRVRGEVAYIDGHWKALSRTATYSDPKKYNAHHKQRAEQKAQDRARMNATPGLRVVRLLDKPSRQTGSGGQAVRRDHGSLQCNLNERSVQL